LLNRSLDLERALDESIDNGNEWNVIGKIDADNFDDDMEIFKKYNTSSVMLDGFFVDENIESGNCDVISKYLNNIEDEGFTPAIETRIPFKNVPLLNNSQLLDNFDEIMLPINFYGYMMDINFLTNENKLKLDEILESISDKKVIANRTLATGILKPKEAYEFIGNVENIDSVCVGVAKTSEAEETFSIINEYKS
jgi:hypothetical protein